MEERVRARGRKGGTPKREGDRRNRRGSEAAIGAEYKVALFRYVDGGRDGARADRHVGEERERGGVERLNSTPDGVKSVRNWITTTDGGGGEDGGRRTEAEGSGGRLIRHVVAHGGAVRHSRSQ